MSYILEFPGWVRVASGQKLEVWDSVQASLVIMQIFINDSPNANTCQENSINNPSNFSCESDLILIIKYI